MNNKKTNKSKPRGRPQVSTLKRLTKSVTVKFSKPDYEMLRHRSKNANCTLAEYIRDSAFDAQIVAKHSAEDAAIIRNLTGMANNLNQLTKLSHQTGFYRTKNVVIELLEKLKSIMNDYKQKRGGADDWQNQEGKILWWLHTLCDGKRRCLNHCIGWCVARNKQGDD